MHRHLLLHVLAGAALSACAPSINRGTPAVVPNADTGSEARTALVRQSSGELRDGIAAANVERIASSLSPDVVLVTQLREEVHGRVAAAAHLAALAGRSYPFTIFPGIVEPCGDGRTQEYGGQFTAAPIDGRSRFSQGTYRIDWETASGVALARRLDFTGGANDGRRANCPLQYVSRSASANWIRLGYESGPGSGANVIAQVDREMRVRGMSYSVPASANNVVPFPRLGRRGGGGMVAIGRSLGAGWSGELRGTFWRSERAEGVVMPEGWRVFLTSRAASASPLLQYRRGPFRVGAGPSLLLREHSVLEMNQRHYWDQLKPEERWITVSDSQFQATKRGTVVGAVGEIAVTLPMSRHVLFDIALANARYGGSHTPAAPHLPAMRISEGSRLGIALSLGYRW